MDTLDAWQCIGCGKLEAAHNCIGVCQDRRVELVYTSEYAALASELTAVEAQRDALAGLVQRIGGLRRGDAAALDALQDEARAMLACRQPPVAAATSPADVGSLRDRRTNASAGDASRERGPARPATLFVR